MSCLCINCKKVPKWLFQSFGSTGWKPYNKLSGTGTEYQPKRSYHCKVLITAFEGLSGSTVFPPKSNFISLFQLPILKEVQKCFSVVFRLSQLWKSEEGQKILPAHVNIEHVSSFKKHKVWKTAHLHMESILRNRRLKMVRWQNKQPGLI